MPKAHLNLDWSIEELTSLKASLEQLFNLNHKFHQDNTHVNCLQDLILCLWRVSPSSLLEWVVLSLVFHSQDLLLYLLFGQLWCLKWNMCESDELRFLPLKDFQALIIELSFLKIEQRSFASKVIRIKENFLEWWFTILIL